MQIFDSHTDLTNLTKASRFALAVGVRRVFSTGWLLRAFLAPTRKERRLRRRKVYLPRGVTEQSEVLFREIREICVRLTIVAMIRHILRIKSL